MQLDGQKIIVTGGAAGIGGAISRLLAERGAKVVAVDINEDEGQKLQSEFEGSVRFLAADVSLPETAEKAVGLAEKSSVA